LTTRARSLTVRKPNQTKAFCVIPLLLEHIEIFGGLVKGATVALRPVRRDWVAKGACGEGGGPSFFEGAMNPMRPSKDSGFWIGFLALLICLAPAVTSTGSAMSQTPVPLADLAPPCPVLGDAIAGGLLSGGRAHPNSGVVTSVIDGDTVRLASGSEVRMMGMQAPKLPLGRKGFKAWPLSPESKAHLEQLSLGKRVRLFYGPTQEDRYGRLLAHLVVEPDADALGAGAVDAPWLQGAMIEAGLARVYILQDNQVCGSALLTLEKTARAAGAGIWAHPFYEVRTPVTVMGEEDAYHLVEGRVVDAAERNRRIFLNFGENWRDDFTVTIAPKHRKAFEKVEVDLLALEGQVVRVRGWVTEYNGPSIVVSHPGQIEIVDGSGWWPF
jgi:endonuclease YncB( thermonuclease family)